MSLAIEQDASLSLLKLYMVSPQVQNNSGRFWMTSYDLLGLNHLDMIVMFECDCEMIKMTMTASLLIRMTLKLSRVNLRYGLIISKEPLL